MSEFNLNDQLRALPPRNNEWQEPSSFNVADPQDAARLEALIAEGKVDAIHDPVALIASDMFEMHNPSKKQDETAKADFTKEITDQGPAFGTWHYFPWSKELVRYPDAEEHRALRTSRNRNLITDEEQQRLYGARVAVFGLSVGSNVIDRLVSSGIGGTVIMGDMDHIEPSNLNRINGVFADVGSTKLDRMGRFISQVDPYINQVHMPEGITQEGMQRLTELAPDIIFDEVDNLAMKASLRLHAKENGVPLVMATDLGDRSIIDVERHDEADTKPFNGRISQEMVEKLHEGALTPEELQKLTLKIVGLRHVTARMLASVMEQGKTLPGLPQLGNTAMVGGALAATAAREIILGKELPSGRYVFSPKKVMKLAPQESFGTGLKTIVDFAKAGKAAKAAKEAQADL